MEGELIEKESQPEPRWKQLSVRLEASFHAELYSILEARNRHERQTGGQELTNIGSLLKEMLSALQAQGFYVLPKNIDQNESSGN